MKSIFFKILCLGLLLAFNSRILLSKNIVLKNNEHRITNSEYSETDPEIIVNPLDNNNLISSSIQHKLNYGIDHYVNAISYSFNKGLTWNRYQEEVLPSEKYRMLSNARDNKLLFDSKGVAHLAWLTTLIKTGFGGIDSVIQVVTYRFSTNKGVSWDKYDFISDRAVANYDVSKEFNGLNETFRNLKLFEYNNDVYVSYSIHSTDSNKASIKLININNSNLNKKIEIPKFYNYLGNYDIKISNNKVHIAFLTYLSRPTNKQILEYYVYNLESELVEIQKRIYEVNFMGSTLIPGVSSYVLPGLPTEFINPKPLINFINDYVLISWYGTDYSKSQLFPKNNIYLCIGANGEFDVPKKILEDTLNHQVNYDLKVNKNNVILVNYYNLEGPFENEITKYNYFVEPRFILSFDNGNSFSEAITYTENAYELTYTQNRNFKYGIGYKTGVSIDNEDIYLTWTDGRLKNGNTEIYSAVYPIYYKHKDLFNKIDIDVSVNKIYPNPFQTLLNIELENYKLQNIDIILFDFNGKVIKNLYQGNIKVGLNKFAFNFDNLAEGNYFINFQTNGEVIYKKLLKVN